MDKLTAALKAYCPKNGGCDGCMGKDKNRDCRFWTVCNMYHNIGPGNEDRQKWYYDLMEISLRPRGKERKVLAEIWLNWVDLLFTEKKSTRRRIKHYIEGLCMAYEAMEGISISIDDDEGTISESFTGIELYHGEPVV